MSLHDPSGINVAMVGVGNCASSLVQGLAYYQNGGQNEQIGLMHWDLGGYRPSDIRVAAAWDVDRRKVGKDVAEAIFAKPNCTTIFCDHVPASGATVEMGRVLDGYSEHMGEWPDDRWRIEVRANAVHVVRLLTEPDRDEYPRTHWDDWTDEQRADFAARTRHNFVYLVRDGQLHEVGPADGTSFDPIPAGPKTG